MGPADMLVPRSSGQLIGGNQGIFLDRKGIWIHVPADKTELYAIAVYVTTCSAEQPTQKEVLPVGFCNQDLRPACSFRRGLKVVTAI